MGRCFIFVFCFLSWAQSASALQIIVDRSEDSIELFLHLEGQQLTPAFGVDADRVIRDEDGELLTPQFQLTGSYDEALKLIGNIQTMVSGQTVAFEPMSMMLHPKSFDLPFNEPFDGWSYMSACSVIPPSGVVQDADLRIVAGYSAYPVDGRQPIEIMLANSADTNVQVMEFFRGQPLTDATYTLSAGESLKLERAPDRTPLLSIFVAISLAAVAASALLWHRNARQLGPQS